MKKEAFVFLIKLILMLLMVPYPLLAGCNFTKHSVTSSIFSLNQRSIDVCLNEGIQRGLGGGYPIGGVYSGSGVIDDGNGSTYTFDPSTAGVGTHNVIYSLGTPEIITNINVIQSDDASFNYEKSVFCLDNHFSGKPLPTISGISGGIFDISEGGVIDSVTGELFISNIQHGIFDVTYNTKGLGTQCPSLDTFKITVSAPPGILYYKGSPFSPTGKVLPSIVSKGTRVFSSSPEGLSIDSTNGEIDLEKSIPGKYFIKRKIFGIGGCSSTFSNSFVEILHPK